MRMSDEEYFRTCIAKERRLAQLLGHEVEEYYESAGTLWENTNPLPQWTREWRACGPLITEFDLAISYGKDEHETNCSKVTVGPTLVHFADHPSKERAVMFGIVKAVIFLLEHGKANKDAHHPTHQSTEEGVPHVSPRH